MKSHSFHSSQFSLYSIVLQQNRIVPGSCHFIFLIETWTITAIRIFQLTRYCLQFSDSRCKYDTAYLELVKIGKAFDGSMTKIIPHCLPTTGISQMRIGRRSQFCHAKRNSSRCIKEPTTMRSSNVWVYIVHQSFSAWSTCCTPHNDTHTYHQKTKSFHDINLLRR